MQPMTNSTKSCSGSARHGDMFLATDPAPSLFSYRMQRLWLTPVFRALVRVGLPTVVMVLLGWMFLSKEDNRGYLSGLLQEAQGLVQSQPVHQLQTLSIEGASTLLQDEIREKFSNLFPISAFDLDLVSMRDWIESIASVERASVITAVGGLLLVQVTEINPEFMWRNVEGLHLVSAEGALLRTVSQRSNFPNLPLILGEGATVALDEVRALIVIAAPIFDRLRGLVRIGERRWDLVLIDDQTISLPEANPEQVLARVIVLSAAQNLFERDILLMDFRNPHRPTLRLQPRALARLKKAKDMAFLEILK